MKTAQPIRNKEDVNKLKLYFIKKKEYRNYLLVTVALNSALRISDVLTLHRSDIYDFEAGRFKTHIVIKEKKTGKMQAVFINKQIQKAFSVYAENTEYKSEFLFANKQGGPLSRVQVHRILTKASAELGIGNVSCHSLRKTFGYYAWQQGAEPALLMQVYNHSSFEITKRYLGITQNDKDRLFNEVML